jgi:hypothetical protein
VGNPIYLLQTCRLTLLIIPMARTFNPDTDSSIAWADESTDELSAGLNESSEKGTAFEDESSAPCQILKKTERFSPSFPNQKH